MRLGRVEINYGYIVDLDDKEMVEQAKASLYEDIMYSCENDALANYMAVNESCAADYWTEVFIPESLRDDALERQAWAWKEKREKEEADG